MIWLKKASHIKDYQVKILFNTGEQKIADFKPYLKGPIFEPLNDMDTFKKLKIDPDLDTITWENGADFAPEFVYKIAR
jgi:hypothetical protein